MNESITKPPNPFVGPSAILEEEPFFGRENELDALIDQLYADRVVLMYSPSGAGKTSLINAGLVPSLRKRFKVLPVLRVNRPIPDTLHGVEGINRYSASVMSSLYDPEDPPGWQFSAYPFEESPTLLILDQFEEILTQEQTDIEQKNAFFEELGNLLIERSNLWALFVMREEYLAALDPYRLTQPGQLRSRFRLDLFTRQQAVEVMVKTAETQKVHFHRQAAEKLANILSGSQVGEQPGGQYVEPVHVQLVCFDLWEKKLQPGGREITQEMVEESGGVDEALARFYASSLEKIAAEKGVKEHRLRILFGCELITKDKIRDQLRIGDRGLIGLENTVSALIGAYLLRSDIRHGTAWFELAHDRLISPVLRNNQTWFEQRPGLFPYSAIVWDRAGRPSDLLLRGAALGKAKAWERDNPDDPLTDLEKAYRKESLEEKVKLQRRWFAVLAIAVIIMGVLLFTNYSNFNRATTNYLNAATAVANHALAEKNSSTAVARVTQAQEEVQKGKATVVALDAQAATQRAQAEEHLDLIKLNSQLAVDAMEALDNSRHRSLLLAAEAVNRAQTLAPADQPAIAHDALIRALASSILLRLRVQTSPVNTLAVNPDGSWLATGGEDGTMRLWNLAVDDPGEGILLNDPDPISPISARTIGAVLALAFSPDGEWLVFGTKNGCLVRFRRSAEGATGYRFNDYHCQGDKQIQHVIISPDSRWLAATSTGQDLWICDLNNCDDLSSSLLRLPGDEPAVTDPTFSPDSRWLATGTQDGAIRLWEMGSLGSAAWDTLLKNPPQADLTLSGHASAVTALDFSPDTHWLASGSQDGFLRLWDIQAEDPQAAPYEMSTQAIVAEALKFSPDGRLLAIVGGNLTGMWDIQALSQKEPGEADPITYAAFPPITHEDLMHDLAFSPGAGTPSLATVSEKGEVKLVRLEPILNALQEGKSPGEIELIDIPLSGYQSQITDLAFSPDGQTLFTASDDLTVIKWLLEQPPLPAILEHPDSVNSAAFSPDGKRLVTASDDGAARVWMAAGWQEPPLVLGRHEGSVLSAAFSPDGEQVATANDDGTARIWDSSEGTELAVLNGHEGSVRNAAFSPDGEQVITASDDGTARIWDASRGTELVVLSGHAGYVNNAAFSPDGKTVITASDDGTARIWDARRGTELVVLQGHADYVSSAAFSPDGRQVVTTSRDGTARIWDATRGTELAVLRGDEGNVISAMFSPDGKWLAAGSDDGTIQLWDMQNPSSLEGDPIILSDPAGGIFGLAFDPTGRWLASGNDAGIVRLWNVAARDSASQVIELPAHQGWINTLAFSPDGDWLATASSDTTAFLWPLEAESLIDLACQEAQSNLTQAEWSQYLPGVEYDPTCP